MEQGGRCWGIAVQLYGLRSARNWGIGDFADLVALAGPAAAAGADFIGVNPLHALFLAEPGRRSPFSPSSRRFLNPLYIAVDAIPGFAPEMADTTILAAVRAAEVVDYDAVAKLKLHALRRLWPAWRAQADGEGPYSAAAFEAFKTAQGAPLARHALFEVLSLSLGTREADGGWQSWPEELRDVDGPGVAARAADEAEAIAFQIWLQWLADTQLAAAQEALLAAGMRIGLYLDLAVGEAVDGSTTWTEPRLAMRGVHVGAPPDYFSISGQDWELAPLAPNALLEGEPSAYGAVIAAALRHAGALRIDHAMGLQQLFLVPAGRSPAEGTYVAYPTRGMTSLLARLSHERQAIVIGEDLGNVPDGFRDLMARACIHSYRILYFERYDGGFISPEHYPTDALACLSTHDLPTLEGWWRGDDPLLRREHGLIDAASCDQQSYQRGVEREQLAGLLVAHGLLSREGVEVALAAAHDAAPLPVDLAVAVHRFLARTPSRMMVARIEDLGGERQPVNLPGTIESYPNWMRRMRVPIEELAETPLFSEITRALSAERPRR
jgi:4-alpha-glucanotransferase